MNIAQLFHKLALIANVEIVVTFLPKVLRVPNQPPRHALLQRLENIGERTALRFVEQQVNVFWHDYIAVHAKSETAPDTLQRGLESSPACHRGEQWTTTVATESDKVTLPRLLKAFESPRHEISLRLRTSPLKPKNGLSGPPAQKPYPEIVRIESSPRVALVGAS